MDYQQEPFSIVWCVRIDGKLTGMTYNRLQDVVAWHEHDFGGTDAKCKSVAVIDVDTDDDQVWVIVERTINGATKKYVEYLTPYNFNSDLEEIHFVDSGLTYSGASTSTLSGLDHLEGETELYETGWMHNRVRMVVGSFLVKHLRINWTEGEKHFRNCLLDFNKANNVAQWQWVAGCGADAAPYFRIFNPILQGEKFDKEGLYVKKWVPELNRRNQAL